MQLGISEAPSPILGMRIQPGRIDDLGLKLGLAV